jgi:serine O-acetyltransferase
MPTSSPATPPSFSELVFSDLLRYRAYEKPSWPKVAARCLTLPGMIASVVLRAQQCLYRAGHVRAAHLLRTVGVVLVGADFTPGMTIGTGLYMPHPNGVVIGNRLVIGDGVYIGQGATAGSRTWEPGAPAEYPVIGDGAVLLAHATVVGGVRVGRHAQVGANSLVVADVADYAVVVGVPARKISSREAEVAEQNAG